MLESFVAPSVARGSLVDENDEERTDWCVARGKEERKEEAHELRTSRPRGGRGSADARKRGQIGPIRLDPQIQGPDWRFAYSSAGCNRAEPLCASKCRLQDS